MNQIPYAIEMVNITKRFPGIIANDNVTLLLRRGEIHALLGENGAGKSTLMSVLFGLYQAEEGVIKKNGEVVKINNPNDANDLGIGMVHQHFKLVECFSVLDNIILGVEDTKNGMLQREQAREKVMALSKRYGLSVDPEANYVQLPSATTQFEDGKFTQADYEAMVAAMFDGTIKVSNDIAAEPAVTNVNVEYLGNLK